MTGATEEDAVVDVGLAAVTKPFVDVVRFAPVGWTIAVRPHASTVAGVEDLALMGGERASGATVMHGVPVRAEHHLVVPVAQVPLDRFGRDGIGSPEKNAEALAPCCGVDAGDESHSRSNRRSSSSFARTRDP